MSTSRLNIFSKMFLIPFLCILTSTSLSAASIQSCESDGDCPHDYYCYTLAHFCTPCISNYCSRFHRKDSIWKQCHQKPGDCGPCLPGYEEEILSDGLNRDSCILLTQQPTTAEAMGYKNVLEGGPSVTYLSSLIGLPGIVLIIGLFVYSRVRRPIIVIPQVEETELNQLNNQSNHVPENESSNASYSEATVPMLPGYTREDPYRPRKNVAWETNEAVTDSYEHTMEIKQKTSCALLQSGVFRRPNYEEDIDNEEPVQDHEAEDEEDVESQEEEGPNRDERLGVPQVQYHDENTMPSSWAPGPGQSEYENTSVSTDPENAKRPSTEMGSSGESEDEQKPNKRLCNSGNEEENESPSMSSFSFYPNLFRNFTAALSSIRNKNNTQNKNTDGNGESKDG